MLGKIRNGILTLIMSVPRVYIDTSVIGGCFDAEFAKWSNGLMKDFRLGHFKPVVSEIIDAELRNAPVRVRDKYLQLIEWGAEFVEIDEEVLTLVAHYLKSRILSAKFENDMRHIALATVHKTDLLLSWNFKHIVHFDKIKSFNAVNEKMGYKPMHIYSPREVANYEEDI